MVEVSLCGTVAGICFTHELVTTQVKVVRSLYTEVSNVPHVARNV